MSTIRKALGEPGGTTLYLETRWAEGYRFIGPCREIDTARPATGNGARAGLPIRSGRRHIVYTSARALALAERLIKRGNAYLGRSGNRNCRYALAMFRQASEINPEDARAQGGYAASHALLYLHEEPTAERRAAAIAISRTALELDPLHAEVQLARAQVAVMCADHAAADAAFRQAESLEPGFFPIWYYHGRGCAEQADHEGALANYMRAREGGPFRLPGDGARRAVIQADRIARRRAPRGSTRLHGRGREGPEPLPGRRARAFPRCLRAAAAWPRARKHVGWSERAVSARAGRAVRQLQRGLRVYRAP